MITTIVVTFLIAFLADVAKSTAATMPKLPPGVPAWPWYALARCEQWTPKGVRWNAYSQTYEGGYGFVHAAWDQWKYKGYPSSANLATPKQQTKVAQRIQRDVGWGAWPSCSIRLGLR